MFLALWIVLRGWRCWFDVGVVVVLMAYRIFVTFLRSVVSLLSPQKYREWESPFRQLEELAAISFVLIRCEFIVGHLRCSTRPTQEANQDK